MKDEDGLYTSDPKKNSDAKFISRIGAQELLDSDPDDMLIERSVIETMRNARHTRQIRIINGLKPGLLTKALNDEDVGSLIYTEPKSTGAKGGQ